MSAQHMLLAALCCLLVSWTQGRLPYFRESPSFSYDAMFDFEHNITYTTPNIVEVVPFSGSGCATQGVLKLALAPAAVDPSRRRVLVDLFMNGNPTEWVFNLGDSSTNNGYAGDAGTQQWDAEVQGLNKVFSGWLSDTGPSGQAFVVRDLYSTRLTLVAGNSHIVWLSEVYNNTFNYYYSPAFYALNGQTDAEGPANYDLYLGINRAIDSSFRSGTGVCRVGIKFLPEF